MHIDLNTSIKDKKTLETINELKTARRMYILFKQRHEKQTMIDFWGAECLRLRAKLKKDLK